MNSHTGLSNLLTVRQGNVRMNWHLGRKRGVRRKQRTPETSTLGLLLEGFQRSLLVG